MPRRKEVTVSLRDPRKDPRPGDELERIMRPLKSPKRRRVVGIRQDDEYVVVRFREGSGRIDRVRLDAWQRWAGTATVVRKGTDTFIREPGPRSAD
jgi:hypothetical protein